MKKTMLFLLFISSICAAEERPCIIYSSPATNFNKVSGTDLLSLSLTKAYYDSNKKLQIRSFSDAAQDFNKQVKNYIYKDCKKYKIKTIYNYKVTHSVDENYYNFIAQYDSAH